MFQEIEDQIGLDFRWYVRFRIINYRRQVRVDGYYLKVEPTGALIPDTFYLAFTGVVLLKDQDSLDGLGLH